MASTLHPAIADAIARGVTLLTANQRAARAIRHAYDSAQRISGQTLWTPANILPLETWFAALWHLRLIAGAESRTLLNPTQEHLLWREIIAADPEAPQLRSPDTLADLAARAWHLLCRYHGHHRLRDFPLSTDNRAFQRWSRAFEIRLARTLSLSAAQLPAELPTAIPTSVALVDFNAHPPAVAAFLERLQQSGLQVEILSTHSSPASSSLFEAEDDRTELQAAASWAQRLRENNPAATIAIVVPNLSDRRALIERVFAPILAPDHLPITAAPAPLAYEFSLGRPLAELPLALTALDLLTWTIAALPIERVSTLLLSPWFAAEDLNAAAAFDVSELRKLPLLRPEITLEATISLIVKSARRKQLDAVLHNLRSLQKAAREHHIMPDSDLSYAQWADTFRTLLNAAGWSRHANAHSLSFQQHRRWDNALDELATLSAIDAKRPTAPEALATLTRILRQTIFAPESTNAPVQILGPLELGGVPYDALWFLGADDLTWPPSISANPLLPRPMQRALAMPGVDRTLDDAYAQALTQRIIHSAAEVVFSFARQAEEGERRPSPLLAALNLTPYGAPALASPIPLQLTSIPDDITLPPLPPGLVRGGTQILKLQAACAFRAFAERRLWSSETETQDLGFNALERGNLVHTVMQHLWTELKSQAALRILPQPAHQALLDQSIDAALAVTAAEDSWDHAYLHIQRLRLHNLLLPWLDLELQRSPFEVQPPEQKKHFQLGPLTLDVRIDRIDTTAHGDVILDYKTGAAAPKQWQGERPDEPQLPLYAILAEQEGRELAGVAFAQLRPGKHLEILGYAENPSILGKRKPAPMEVPTLAEQVELWRFHLTTLAENFAAGHTEVVPKSYPETCKHCGQRILCRLNPATLANISEEEEEVENALADD